MMKANSLLESSYSALLSTPPRSRDCWIRLAASCRSTVQSSSSSDFDISSPTLDT